MHLLLPLWRLTSYHVYDLLGVHILQVVLDDVKLETALLEGVGLIELLVAI